MTNPATHSRLPLEAGFRSMQLRLICIYVFIIYGPAAVFSSFFPLYYREIGYTDAMYGLQNALLPIIGMIANALFGMISDKLSRMKPILLTLMALMMVSIYFIFHVSNVWLVMGLVFLFQFLWVPVNSLTDSMAMLAARRLDAAYATIRGCGAAGFAVAAVVIGWVLDLLPGRTTMGWVAIILVALTWIALLPVRDPRELNYMPGDEQGGPSASAEKPKVKMNELLQYVRTPRFLWFIATLVLYQMTFAFNDQYFTYLIHELNGSQFYVGMGWMLPAAIEIGIFMYFGRIRQRFRPLPMLAISAVILMLRSFVIAWTDALWLVMVMQAIQGIAIAFYFTFLADYMMELIPDRFRASGQALLFMMISLGATMTGSLIGAYIYAELGVKTLYGASGILLILATAGFLWTEQVDRRFSRIHS